MTGIVDAALPFWGMADAPYRLIAARENQVFRVDHRGMPHALRLHRPGYRSDAELRSELLWLAAAAEAALTVPAPIPAENGAHLVQIDGVQIDMLSWCPGAPLAAPGEMITVADPAAIYHQLGTEMARLHRISDAWTPPPEFSRAAWDRPGLVGACPLWGRFWDNPGLSAGDRRLFERFRKIADHALARLEGRADYGLIHADLVPANVMADGQRVALIDFDDGGFGYRVFEIATAMLPLRRRPDFGALSTALIAGYQSQRAIDLSDLDLFLALRAASYVGWNIARMTEAGGAARNQRFIATARDMIGDYLDHRRRGDG